MRLEPSAQASHDGLRTTTSTVTVSPGATSARGARRPPLTASGMRAPPGPNAFAETSEPPSGCSSTRASATGSSRSVAPDHQTTAAASPSATTAIPAANTQIHRRALYFRLDLTRHNVPTGTCAEE